MNFWTKFAEEGYLWSKAAKVKIVIAYFSLGTKFLLKLKILNFWTKFAQKAYFQSKAEKVGTTIELFIFELVYNRAQGVAHGGRGLISAFQGILIGADGVFISGGGLSARQ